jgi:hypothetical protein
VSAAAAKWCTISVIGLITDIAVAVASSGTEVTVIVTVIAAGVVVAAAATRYGPTPSSARDAQARQAADL